LAEAARADFLDALRTALALNLAPVKALEALEATLRPEKARAGAACACSDSRRIRPGQPRAARPRRAAEIGAGAAGLARGAP
jgi:hypothetical protein